MFNTCPPVKKIAEALNIDATKAKLIRAVIKGERSPLDVNVAPLTVAWSEKCYHAPKLRECIVKACDEIAGTYGAEVIDPQEDWKEGYPRLEYLNTGDTYSATLIFDFDTMRVYIASWGDVAERFEV